MHNLNRTLQFFCKILNLQMESVEEHHLDTQYHISDGINVVHVSIYHNKTILVQGKESELKHLFLLWSNKEHNLPTYCITGQACFGQEWREWNEEIDFYKKAKTSYNQIFHRDRLFHDYMFRQKQLCTISTNKSIDVIKSWFDKNCFMNIPEESFFSSYRSYLDNTFGKNENPSIDMVGDALSYAMSIHCSSKMPNCSRCRGCPHVGFDNTACLLNLVDTLYIYTNANEVVTFSKSNLNIFLGKAKGDIKWTNIEPSTPIEKIMDLKLKDACFPIIPQFQAYDSMHKYKLDFLLKTNSDYKIGIECDGLEYHAQKQQYVLDRKRDRYLQRHNILLMRFASVEIFNNIDDCIKEIDSQFWEIKKKTFDLKNSYKFNYFGIDENE